MSVSVTAPHTAPARERSVVRAVLALVRWPNALIASAGVLLGAWWVRPGDLLTRDVLLAVVASWFVTASVNAFNDAFDVEIDRVAHPDRPLPRGELSTSTAFRIGTVAMLFAFALGRAASTEVGMLILGALVAAYGYARELNRRVLIGNGVVAVVASLPFVVGAAAVASGGDGLPLFAVAVPLHFARELMKDLADAPGDRGRRRTVALAWGRGVARGLAFGAVLAYAVVATFLFAPAGAMRLALAPSVALAAWAAARASDRRAPLLLKLSMLLALAALPLLREPDAVGPSFIARTVLQALILGIIEGITEFLPISSTAHLSLANHAFGIVETEFVKSFDIIIQLGAILSVVVLYWRRLWKVDVLAKLAVAFLPTGIIGLTVYKVVKGYLLGNVPVMVAALTLGGAILIWFDRRQVPVAEEIDFSEITYTRALLVGLFQSLAMIPGTSRSAATIIGGSLLGISRRTIVEFSFMLAVPTMLAASLYDLLKSHEAIATDVPALAIGFVVSFVTAILAIKGFLAVIKKRSFAAFGAYRIALGVVVLLVLYFNR